MAACHAVASCLHDNAGLASNIRIKSKDPKAVDGGVTVTKCNSSVTCNAGMQCILPTLANVYGNALELYYMQCILPTLANVYGNALELYYMQCILPTLANVYGNALQLYYSMCTHMKCSNCLNDQLHCSPAVF
jgi:hypothetical protein